jgi:putative DNA methylase
MRDVVDRISKSAVRGYPITIYYAFKQSEGKEQGEQQSTGWETFLEALVTAGLGILGTWPIRTERPGRLRDTGSNALASSIVLVCRDRGADAIAVSRSDFRRLLKREIPNALRLLQEGNIAPVDLPQAAIGPGMAIFSRHAKVLEPDGSTMTVRTALQLINEALDEYLTEQEGDFDSYTRFGLTWYEQHRWAAGTFGDAENLAKARNIAVTGVAEAGFLEAKAGKVRLLERSKLPTNWDPATDARPTVWEATQHLIKRLETDGGERAAAELLARLGVLAQPARDLAYRLYTMCERKKWADDAMAYNALVVAWPELQRLAEKPTESSTPTPVQQDLL